MCYILYMNKDVIYIEPDDDITDVISKIESSKEKIIALVPPKKAGIFRSVVNIKLISKAGTTAKKKIVLVTTDPAIIKIAASTKIPVTKDLQTVPVIPEVADDSTEVVKEELIEESDGTVETKEDVDELVPKPEEDKASDTTDEEEDDEEDDDDSADPKSDKKKSKKEAKESAKARKAQVKATTGKNPDNWFKKHLLILILGGVFTAGAVVFLVWAFTIAPAATVNVGIRTTSANFSENVTFTNELSKEDVKTGEFYLEEIKKDFANSAEFEATGEKNVGEKASGEVIVYAFFKEDGTVPISAGTTFTLSDLSYVSTKDTSLSWDGKDISECDNKLNASQLLKSGCQISGRISVVATNPGTGYNVSASVTGWSTTANVGVYTDTAMSGGTDDIKKIVSQTDVDKAREALATSDTTENKKTLLEGISDDKLVIDSSFTQTVSDPVSTPAVGEEVKEGTKPTIKVTTTAKIYAIDKTKVKEFIAEKAKIDQDQKIYEMNTPFVENFFKGEGGYTGKLKTAYSYGPKITDSDVVEIVKGKGMGDAQHALKDINGVTNVKIDPSYPWVTSIPNDTNKITVNINVDSNQNNQ